MNQSLKTGFSFGLTSAVITTLGLIIGLEAGTHSRLVVLGGILTIAIADAFSDALGMHVSVESENHHTPKQIWASTAATFLSKLVFALTFIVPVIFLNLNQAIIINIIWGFLILGIFSYYLAKLQKIKPLNVILEHLFTGAIVIIVAHFVGQWIGANLK